MQHFPEKFTEMFIKKKYGNVAYSVPYCAYSQIKTKRLILKIKNFKGKLRKKNGDDFLISVQAKIYIDFIKLKIVEIFVQYYTGIGHEILLQIPLHYNSYLICIYHIII